MSKKDITFIKFIKPQVKKKEVEDKNAHRQAEYYKAGIQPPSLTIEDVGLLASILNKLNKEDDNK